VTFSVAEPAEFPVPPQVWISIVLSVSFAALHCFIRLLGFDECMTCALLAMSAVGSSAGGRAGGGWLRSAIPLARARAAALTAAAALSAASAAGGPSTSMPVYVIAQIKDKYMTVIKMNTPEKFFLVISVLPSSVKINTGIIQRHSKPEINFFH
jgi:hypothetical protein